MDRLCEFDLKRPTSAAEVVALLADVPGSRLLAGGTDLIPNLRRGIDHPAMLVDLGAVDGLAAIALTDGGLSLGAGVTLSALAGHTGVASVYRAIGDAAGAIAGPAHRSAATVGGNLCVDTRCVFYNQSEWWRAANHYCLKRGGDTCHVAPQGKRCHAAFSGDLAPALLVLGSEVEILGSAGLRRIALADLYRDDGAAHLTIASGELIVRVFVPAPGEGIASGYRKARARGAIDFPLAGVACALAMRDGAVSAIRVALTGTNPRPILLTGTDALLGKPVGEESLAALGKLVQKQVSPMRTTVTQSNYRRQVASVLAQRLVRDLASPAAR